MNAGELFKLTRSFLGDEAHGHADDLYLSDGELYDYLNDAVNEACRRAHLLVDSKTSSVCSGIVTMSDPWITLDSRVVSILDVKLASVDTPLTPISTAYAESRYPNWRSQAGTPFAYLPDAHTGALRLVWIPDADDTAWMKVARLPLTALSGQDDTPEIDAQFHFALTHRMQWWASLKEETKLYNPDKALRHNAMFEETFGPPVSAGEEMSEKQDAINESNYQDF